MRKAFFLLSALVIQLSLTAQEKQVLEGNGNLVTKDISIQSFSALKASGVYELKLLQGSSESVKIEADENLQDLFTVKNEGNTLVIDMKKMEKVNLKTKNKMKVFVTFRNLKEIDLKMVGNVSNEGSLSFDALQMKNKSVGNVDLNLSVKKISIDNSSVGNLKLKGKADDAEVKSHGVGSVEAADFITQTLYIENSGVGNANVNAVKQLKVKDHFLGKVQNKGAAPMRKMNKVPV